MNIDRHHIRRQAVAEAEASMQRAEAEQLRAQSRLQNEPGEEAQSAFGRAALATLGARHAHRLAVEALAKAEEWDRSQERRKQIEGALRAAGNDLPTALDGARQGAAKIDKALAMLSGGIDELVAAVAAGRTTAARASVLAADAYAFRTEVQRREAQRDLVDVVNNIIAAACNSLASRLVTVTAPLQSRTFEDIVHQQDGRPVEEVIGVMADRAVKYLKQQVAARTGVEA